MGMQHANAYTYIHINTYTQMLTYTHTHIHICTYIHILPVCVNFQQDLKRLDCPSDPSCVSGNGPKSALIQQHNVHTNKHSPPTLHHHCASTHPPSPLCLHTPSITTVPSTHPPSPLYLHPPSITTVPPPTLHHHCPSTHPPSPLSLHPPSITIVPPPTLHHHCTSTHPPSPLYLHPPSITTVPPPTLHHHCTSTHPLSPLYPLINCPHLHSPSKYSYEACASKHTLKCSKALPLTL